MCLMIHNFPDLQTLRSRSARVFTVDPSLFSNRVYCLPTGRQRRRNQGRCARPAGERHKREGEGREPPVFSRAKLLKDMYGNCHSTVDGSCRCHPLDRLTAKALWFDSSQRPRSFLTFARRSMTDPPLLAVARWLPACFIFMPRSIPAGINKDEIFPGCVRPRVSLATRSCWLRKPPGILFDNFELAKVEFWDA